MPAKQKAPPDGVASEQTLTTSATVKDRSQDRVCRLHSLGKVIFLGRCLERRSNLSTFLPVDFQWGLVLLITQSCLVPPFYPPVFYSIWFICGAIPSNEALWWLLFFSQRKQQKPRRKHNVWLLAFTLTTTLPCSQALPLVFPAPHWEYLEFEE